MIDYEAWGQQLKAHREAAGFSSQQKFAETLMPHPNFPEEVELFEQLEIPEELWAPSYSTISRWEKRGADKKFKPPTRSVQLMLILRLARLEPYSRTCQIDPAMADAWLRLAGWSGLSDAERAIIFGASEVGGIEPEPGEPEPGKPEPEEPEPKPAGGHVPPPIPVKAPARPEDQRALLTAVRQMVAAQLVSTQPKGRDLLPVIFERRVRGATQPEPLGEGTTLAQARHKLIGPVALLGEPGAGKSTLLRRFAALKIEQAEEDAGEPLPVYLTLATWTRAAASFEAWLYEQFKTQLVIDGRRAQTWIEGGAVKLLLILDGLDEIAAEGERRHCLSGLVDFCARHYANVEVVVGCVLNVFERLGDMPDFHRLTICPLTGAQVTEYLETLGAGYEEPRARIEADPLLKEFINTPLVLGLLIEMTDDDAGRELPHFADTDELLAYLYGLYIKNRFARRQAATGSEREAATYTEEETRRWLGWLAGPLDKVGGGIERMQPSLINAPGLKWVYLLGSRLLAGLCIGWVVGQFAGGPGHPWLFGTVAGLLVAVIDGAWLLVLHEWLRARFVGREALGMWLSSALYSVVVLLVLSVNLGIISGFITPRSALDRAFLGVLEPRGVYLGLFAAVVFTILFSAMGERRELESDVKLIGVLQWQDHHALRGALIGAGSLGFAIGALAVTAYYSGSGVMSGWLETQTQMVGGGLVGSWNLGMITGMVFGALLGGLRGGLQTRELTAGAITPDTGLRLIARNALSAGLSFTLVCALPATLLFSWRSESLVEFVHGMQYVLGVGLMAALWYGGFALIQHGTLRAVLAGAGVLPWRVVRFLRHANDLGFVYWAGTSYGFPHKSLAETFGAQGTAREAVHLRHVGALAALVLLGVWAFALANEPVRAAGSARGPEFVYPGGQALMQTELCVAEGARVRVEARGFVFVGNFLRSLGAEGTRQGFMGYGLSDRFNVEKSLPHAALMCRVAGESSWRHCGRGEILPGSGGEVLYPESLRLRHLPLRLWNYLSGNRRGHEFTAEQGGCLEFSLNDLERENNVGAFRVRVEIVEGEG